MEDLFALTSCMLMHAGKKYKIKVDFLDEN